MSAENKPKGRRAMVAPGAASTFRSGIPVTVLKVDEEKQSAKIRLDNGRECSVYSKRIYRYLDDEGGS
ncbi:hypothetical protein [Frankia sp. R43]|uniref:hypothetical protein n=1 Tax=Frankia sp. R43 TaxID=269536 RepID=UPI000AA66DB1|nr:hypothetical protein [Frankia sp. R43]